MVKTHIKDYIILFLIVVIIVMQILKEDKNSINNVADQVNSFRAGYVRSMVDLMDRSKYKSPEELTALIEFSCNQYMVLLVNGEN
jgi:hypothetical protein